MSTQAILRRNRQNAEAFYDLIFNRHDLARVTVTVPSGATSSARDVGSGISRRAVCSRSSTPSGQGNHSGAACLPPNGDDSFGRLA